MLKRLFAVALILSLAMLRMDHVRAGSLAVAQATPSAQPSAPPAMPQASPEASPQASAQPTAYIVTQDQSAVYDVPNRSYDLLRSTDSTSYPNFGYFLDFDQQSKILPGPPGFVPQCSTTGVSAPGSLVDKATSGSKLDPAEQATQVRNYLTIAYNDLDDLLWRYRACDFDLSIYAWNTRSGTHDTLFNYSWKAGCNSLQYEKSAYPDLLRYSGDLAAYIVGNPVNGNKPPQTAEQLATFLLRYYQLYSDLYNRVSSCSAIVSNTTYKPNTHRVFCNYGAFMGALITGYAAAFGHHWGGTNNSTQPSVTAVGTVTIASPSLCQNVATPKNASSGY
ncbi:MAG: hypothetical protein ACLPYS_00025 [Vulcanimicrobiaceae bacterium]